MGVSNVDRRETNLLSEFDERFERKVIAYRNPELEYPSSVPFDPQCSYPEYPFSANFISSDNSVYAAVREVLRLSGLDEQRFNTPEWNPLSELVKVGGTVLIKPNWVRHYHLRGENIFSMITHPSVLRPLVDFAFKAVGPSGRIWIMDAPLFDADFSILQEICQLAKMEELLRARGVPLTIADLRSLVAKTKNGVVIERIERKVWESEGVEFDLAGESEFFDIGPYLGNVFGSDYDRRVTSSHHTLLKNDRQRHRYKISRRVLEADLVISVPKLKTHKKTGVTLNIKNMIGINTDKNYIPHYRVGSPSGGGDEFPDTQSSVKRSRRWVVRRAIDFFLGKFGNIGQRLVYVFMTVWLTLNKGRLERKRGRKLDPIDIFYQTFQGDHLRTGNWWGNDTCWRPGLDINKILIYGALDGKLHDQPLRQYLSIIDGVVSGEGDGPVAPSPRHDGVLIAGFDPISVDVVATQVMGFDPNRIRDLRRSEDLGQFPLTQHDRTIKVYSNVPDWQGTIRPESALNFRPHYGWVEYLDGKND